MAEDKRPEALTLEQAIGRILRGLRKKRKLKQIEVAVATNFGLRTIGTMERGNQSMTIRSLDALSTFYSVSIEDIITRAKELRSEGLR